MYKRVFQAIGKSITSMVLTKPEFKQFCNLLETIEFTGMTPEQVKQNVLSIRHAKHVPLLQRGPKTEPIFARYEIETDRLAVTERGMARRMVNQVIDEGPVTVTGTPEQMDELQKQNLARLPPNTRKQVESDAAALAKRLSTGLDIKEQLTKLARQYAPGCPGPFVEEVLASVEHTLGMWSQQVGAEAAVRSPRAQGYFARLLSGIALMYQEQRERN